MEIYVILRELNIRSPRNSPSALAIARVIHKFEVILQFKELSQPCDMETQEIERY